MVIYIFIKYIQQLLHKKLKKRIKKDEIAQFSFLHIERLIHIYIYVVSVCLSICLSVYVFEAVVQYIYSCLTNVFEDIHIFLFSNLMGKMCISSEAFVNHE